MSNSKEIISLRIGVIMLLGLAACQSDQAGMLTAVPSETPKPAANTPTPNLASPSQTASVPRPTHTPAATATLLDQPTLWLNEDFSRESTCMESFDNERARGEVEAGVYVLEVYASDEVVNANCETLVVGDFSLEVDITVESFTAGGSYYFGLLFRISGDERYAYVIGNEGGYCVYYASNQLFVPLTNSTDFLVQCWTLLPESATVVGVQRLRVVAVSDRMDFFLNGELVAVLRDRQLGEGWVGFVVATAGGGGVRVTFDNLTVTRP